MLLGRPRPDGRARPWGRVRPRPLEAVHLWPVLNPVQPMLAASAADEGEALGLTGRASVEWKLDGARMQVDRLDDEVKIFTRNLNDVTPRMPGVVTFARVVAEEFILDGEMMAGTRTGRPRHFRTR